MLLGIQWKAVLVMCRYVWLGANSTFKADSDLLKYEKARKLKDYITDIRANYTRDWDAKDTQRRQVCARVQRRCHWHDSGYVCWVGLPRQQMCGDEGLLANSLATCKPSHLQQHVPNAWFLQSTLPCLPQALLMRVLCHFSLA